ncbi:MAG: EamA family transporter [Clostridia bacterium]|nr:EamA family transporter [Clostridia bacterium]
MIKEILIILSCVPLYIINSFCDKYISSRNGNRYNFVYNCIKFLIGSVCLLPFFIFDSSPKFRLGVVVCGIACGMMYAVSKTIILKGYEKTSVAFMTLCHSSGMIIPCVIGHFWGVEKLSIISFIGILLVIVSILLIKDSKTEKKSFELAGIIIGIIVFLASGGVMIAQKLMGLYFPEQSVSAYNFYSFVVAFLILSFFLRHNSLEIKDRKCLFLCAIGSSVSLCTISLVMTGLAGSVPSVILFPLFNGLGIIFVCIGSVFVFKEKMTTKKIIGLILGVFALCLVNF